METRNKTKLIIKNVEMLENQNFDKIHKVLQWLDTLHEDLQHINSRDQLNNIASQVDTTENILDSDSSVNTGN